MCVQDDASHARRASFFSKWHSYAASHSVPEIIWQLYRVPAIMNTSVVFAAVSCDKSARCSLNVQRTMRRQIIVDSFVFSALYRKLAKRETDLSTARALAQVRMSSASR